MRYVRFVRMSRLTSLSLCPGHCEVADVLCGGFGQSPQLAEKGMPGQHGQKHLTGFAVLFGILRKCFDNVNVLYVR